MKTADLLSLTLLRAGETSQLLSTDLLFTRAGAANRIAASVQRLPAPLAGSHKRSPAALDLTGRNHGCSLVWPAFTDASASKRVMSATCEMAIQQPAEDMQPGRDALACDGAEEIFE
jgi:hypothetical protein